MKKAFLYIGFLSFFLMPFLTSCFTGIENTGHISDRTVAKVKANKATAEEQFLDSLRQHPFSEWRQGKRFCVSSNDIRLVLRPAADSLKGRVLTFAGTEIQRDIDNTDEVVLLFKDGTNTYRYESGKSMADLKTLRADYVVPFLTDCDYVEAVDSLLRGRRLYLRTSLWRKPNGEIEEEGLRYVPVTVTSVTPGDAVYPFYVTFDYEGRKSGLFMSSPTSSVKNMTFDKLFSFKNIRNSHKQISDEVWDKIVRGQVAAGMTKEECTLSLGSPRSVDNVPTHAGLVERWVYDNGVYLVFSDGILERYRK